MVGLVFRESFAIISSTPILIIFGSILGSCLRFSVLSWFYEKLKSKNLGTLVVNILATFAFVFLTTLNFNPENYINLSASMTIFGIGFLGSFSTFSTFVLEIIEEFMQSNFSRALSMICFSVVGGLLSAYLGYFFATLGIGTL